MRIPVRGRGAAPTTIASAWPIAAPNTALGTGISANARSPNHQSQVGAQMPWIAAAMPGTIVIATASAARRADASHERAYRIAGAVDDGRPPPACASRARLAPRSSPHITANAATTSACSNPNTPNSGTNHSPTPSTIASPSQIHARRVTRAGLAMLEWAVADDPSDDRRSEVRRPIELKVEYKRLNTFFADYTKNISRGGTFIKTARPLPIGTEFLFKLFIPGRAEPLTIHGEVQRIVTGEKQRHRWRRYAGSGHGDQVRLPARRSTGRDRAHRRSDHDRIASGRGCTRG